MNQNNQLTEAEKKEVQEEKRVVFFEGNSWYHRTKELMDDLTTKYSKKGGFKTPEEAEKSYWEYEERYRFSIGLNIFILCGLRQRQECWDRIRCMN